MNNIKDFIDHPPKFLYEKLIANKKGNSSFTILIFFLLTFGITRLAVYLFQYNLLPPSPISNLGGTHVHHFVVGIIVVCLTGLLSLTLPRPIFLKWRLKLAALYGFGLGYIFDEFGMWLNLENNYLLRQSYDAIIVVTVILINFIYFHKIWATFTNYLIKVVRIKRKKK